jgi:hypothetical protein
MTMGEFVGGRADYVHEDWTEMMPYCESCDKPIPGDVAEIGGSKFHPECIDGDMLEDDILSARQLLEAMLVCCRRFTNHCWRPVGARLD